MQFDAATIERMVRDVLNQIQHASTIGPSSTSQSTLLKVPETKEAAPAVVVQPATHPQVTLGDRVITAELLKEKAKSGTQLVIASKSIITPAAQDYLRLNRIQWVRGTLSTGTEAAAKVSWRILISTATDPVKRAIDAVCRQQTQVKHEIVGSALEAAQAVVTAISRAEVPGIIVVTSAPHVVACRVNRSRAIRAAVVTDLNSWSAVQSTLSPNVVCLDPTERSFMELQNVLNRVVSGPAPQAPANWSE